MARDETVLILRHMSFSLPNFNYREAEILETWHSIFKDYDYNDVFKKVNCLLEEDRFQYQAPTPQFVVRDLRKIAEKKKLNSYKVFCQICNRLHNSYDEQVQHFDRCSSVDYIFRQYKRFNKVCSKTKKDLFEMSDSKFKEYYELILKWVQEKSTNLEEKTRIESVFNPPSEEKARKILNKK